MYKYFLCLLLGLVSIAGAQSLLTEEGSFFAIPGLDSLSNAWFADHPELGNFGFAHPVDVELLRLSGYDYRIVILDSRAPHFYQFRMDQRRTFVPTSIICSGDNPDDSTRIPSAMCLVQHGPYFDSQRDRIAVVFKVGGKIALYRFDPSTGEFHFDRMFANAQCSQPVGLFWAFDNFFVVDEATQSIIRTDSLGNVVSHYGREGLHLNGYSWISDISGYVDVSNTAHLYVSDGWYGRLDHLTATASDTTIRRHSQVWARHEDTDGLKVHQPAYVPGAGVAGLDRSIARIYVWNTTDSLQRAVRGYVQRSSLDSRPVHLVQTAGRLITINLSSSGGWVLRTHRALNAQFDNPAPYPTDHWTRNESPVLLTSTWHVTSGTELTIDPGVDVVLSNGASVIVDGGGRLTVNGQASGRVAFSAAGGGQTSWTGIKVEPGAAITMTYATVSGADSFCVFADTPSDSTNMPLRLENCHFDGGALVHNADAVRIFAKPDRIMRMAGCRVDNVTHGRGLYLYNCFVDFNGDSIMGCDTSNTYLKQVSGYFRNCYFQGRSRGHGVLFEGPDCTPNFQCCTFKDLASADGTVVPLQALKGTGPTFGWEDNSNNGVSNVITDSASSLLSFAKDMVMPIIDNIIPGGGAGGKNDWYQRNTHGYYLRWEGAVLPPYPAENQYWNAKPDVSKFYPSTSGYFLYDTTHTNPWGLCGSGHGLLAKKTIPGRPIHGSQDLDDLESDLALFSSAMTAEQSSNYSSAQDQFRSIVSATTNAHFRWQSLTHIISTQRHLSGETGDAWIPALLDSAMALDSSAYATEVYGHRLLAAYRTDRGQYDDAITLCTDLLGSGLTTEDSLLVAIDLIGVQLLANHEGGNGLDSPHPSNIPVGLQVYSVSSGLALEEELLRRLNTSGHTAKPTPTVPTKYTLYQNYPNPFNPQTEIRFDLPEATRVEVKIFNTLGQLVTTLVNETRPAGAYTVTFDGSRMASGLYLYQLKAGPFTDTKKMLLLK